MRKVITMIVLFLFAGSAKADFRCMPIPKDLVKLSLAKHMEDRTKDYVYVISSDVLKKRSYRGGIKDLGKEKYPDYIGWSYYDILKQGVFAMKPQDVFVIDPEGGGLFYYKKLVKVKIVKQQDLFDFGFKDECKRSLTLQALEVYPGICSKEQEVCEIKSPEDVPAGKGAPLEIFPFSLITSYKVKVTKGSGLTLKCSIASGIARKEMTRVFVDLDSCRKIESPKTEGGVIVEAKESCSGKVYFLDGLGKGKEFSFPVPYSKAFVRAEWSKSPSRKYDYKMEIQAKRFEMNRYKGKYRTTADQDLNKSRKIKLVRNVPYVDGKKDLKNATYNLIVEDPYKSGTLVDPKLLLIKYKDKIIKPIRKYNKKKKKWEETTKEFPYNESEIKGVAEGSICVGP